MAATLEKFDPMPLVVLCNLGPTVEDGSALHRAEIKGSSVWGSGEEGTCVPWTWIAMLESLKFSSSWLPTFRLCTSIM
jgi:hypothetical protein